MREETWMDLAQQGIESTIHNIDLQDITSLARRILAAKRTFLMGSGRTGLVVEMFAMRLAQLGLPVFLVSHPTTPALEQGDLLLLVSGSGETGSVLSAAKKALEIGSGIYAITQHARSSLGKIIQDKLIIPSPQEPARVLNGTLFELTLLITLDAVVSELLEHTGQHFGDMSARHANVG